MLPIRALRWAAYLFSSSTNVFELSFEVTDALAFAFQGGLIALTQRALLLRRMSRVLQRRLNGLQRRQEGPLLALQR